MNKSDAESSVRHLCHVWGDEVGISRAAESEPSFLTFKSWLDQKGYGHYLNFRSVRGASADAELWFDEEFKQQWRN